MDKEISKDLINFVTKVDRLERETAKKARKELIRIQKAIQQIINEYLKER